MITGDAANNADEIAFVNLTSGSGNAFDIDMAEGALNNKTGVCVDVDSSYNEGCSIETAATVKDSLVGCFDGVAGALLCGLSLEVLRGDPSTARLEGSAFWPRTLLEGGQDQDGDGRAGPKMQCSDPVDCLQKYAALYAHTLHNEYLMYLVQVQAPRAHLAARRGRAAYLCSL